LFSARSRHPGSDPVSSERVEAAARAEPARRAADRPEADPVADETVLEVARADALAAVGEVALRELPARVPRRFFPVFVTEGVAAEVAEPFTKRTGFFARDAVDELGLRFLEEAMINIK